MIKWDELCDFYDLAVETYMYAQLHSYVINVYT